MSAHQDMETALDALHRGPCRHDDPFCNLSELWTGAKWEYDGLAKVFAAARAVVEERAKLSFEMEPVEWTDQVFTVLLSIDALRAAIERMDDG